MPKAKRSAGGDFVKKKQKLGKKKLAPTNSTSTAFRARSVVLLEQSLAAEREGPVSQRKLTLGFSDASLESAFLARAAHLGAEHRPGLAPFLSIILPLNLGFRKPSC